MKSLSTVRTTWCAVAVAVLLLLGAHERAEASLYPTDVLAGQLPIASSNWGYLNPTLPLFGYANPGASITFDLGKPWLINGFGIAGEVINISAARYNWSTVRLEFSDSPTFASETFTDIVLTPLVTQGVMETSELSNMFLGRYVRITDTASTPQYTSISQLSLFGIPEPSSLALLAVGGLMVSRFRRRTNADNAAPNGARG